MYGDQKAAVKGYSKTKSYHEVYGNYKFEEKILDLDTDGKGNKGNIISYGRLVGYYAGEENPDPSEWVAWVTGD